MIDRFQTRATGLGTFLVVDTLDQQRTMIPVSKWTLGRFTMHMGRCNRFLSRVVSPIARGKCMSFAIVGGAESGTNMSDADWFAAFLNGKSAVQIVKDRVATVEELTARCSQMPDGAGAKHQEVVDLMPC